ncbi:flagellar brake protein [Hydrogenothermus marinus]|uniref:C-di-GMP-binding flagellar brake protein YcgR n=1 Tax=Hydrogenothermus marinus TaxID=133270 RepID=A0A3M0BKN8_9AQUI|nr:PilZ domain-containing protein [Hydrogenothermus marinus]RMA97801.1 c-di-GMP-binding flagellar brake protein YcgR [Hydrogenothermus marinus]
MDERVNILVEAFKRTTEKGVSIEGILIVIFLFSAIAGIILFSYNFKNILEKRRLKKLFIDTAREIGLTTEEVEILWNTAHKINRDPYLALEVKQTFEKIIDTYIKENPNFDQEKIRHMRKVLGFDIVPPFMPLTTTKDIDLFQSGNLILEDRRVDVALVDKDELYMYWAVLDPVPVRIEKGEKVLISFIRNNDAIYRFESIIEDIYKENDRTILKLPHTFHLERIQRRKDIRIPVTIPIKIYIKDLSFSFKTEDLSISGLKFCIPKTEDNNIKIFNLGAELNLEIYIENKIIETEGKIKNIYDREDRICFGIQFINLKKEYSKILEDFIKVKQMEFLKQYKKTKG